MTENKCNHCIFINYPNYTQHIAAVSKTLVAVFLPEASFSRVDQVKTNNTV